MRKQLRSGWRSPSLRERVFEGMKACLESGDLCTSRDLYSLVIKSGLDSVGIVADHLIRLFAFGSSLLEALYVFNHVHQPSLYTWNIIISAHIQLGHPQGALALYGSMPISPDQITLSCVLKASINSDDIQAGRQAHSQITFHGIPLDFVISGTLVHLYAKLGTLEEAARVFDCLPCRDVISWGAIIEGFLEKGEFYHALCYLRRMYQHGVSPNKVVLLLGLRACRSVAAARNGRPIHAEVCKLGFEKDTMLQSALVEMYSKCEFLEEVESIFHRADHIDLVLWSSILGAYVHSSKHELAFETYKRMVAGAIPPDRVIFLFLLQTCGSAENISEGFYVHKEMAMRGLDKGIVAENALISMYNNCGHLRQANQIFHGMQFRDEVSWNVIITGHINCGRYNEGLELFGNMQLEGVLPNVSVLSSILIACGNSLAMEEGHLIHQYILRYDLANDICINNGLVHMYSSLGMLKDSQIIFDKIMEKNICSWSSMILGFAEQGRVHDVLNLLATMQQEGLLPDKGVVMCGLSACGLAGALADGNCVCHLALNYGVDLDLRLACETVGMYVDCGTLKDAEAVFDQVEKPDVALWSSLIAGFCEFGEVSCAIRSVGEMLNAGLEPDDISYLGLLKLCCELGSLEEGMLLHSQIVQVGFDRNSFVSCSVIDMYMKFMTVDDANYLFKKCGSQDLAIWSSMFSHLGSVGNHEMMHQTSERIEGEGLKQTGGILSNICGACSPINRQMDGGRFSQSMRDHPPVLLSTGHDTGLVDRLGGAGQLNDAKGFWLGALSPIVLSSTLMLESYHVYGDKAHPGYKLWALNFVKCW